MDLITLKKIYSIIDKYDLKEATGDIDNWIGYFDNKMINNFTNLHINHLSDLLNKNKYMLTNLYFIRSSYYLMDVIYLNAAKDEKHLKAIFQYFR